MATIVRGKNPNKPYTVRYYHDGRQRERSFERRKEAQDFLVKFEHDSREQTFVDPKVAGEKFARVAERWLARHPGSPNTLKSYEINLRLHVLPAFGSRPLAAVAADRESAERFLRETLPAKGAGASLILSCYILLKAIVNDSIKAGRLGPNANRLRGIAVDAPPRRAEILFVTHEGIELMAAAMPEGYRHTIHMMRGCGLRLGEALGEMAIPPDRTSLRIRSQLDTRGREYVPLKHRRADDFRDIPLPAYVAAKVSAGPRLAVPPIDHRGYRRAFNKARDAAGVPPSVTPHTLRHIFASVCLAGGVPITDVSKWLGHRDINMTFSIYGHLVPSSWGRARGVLDAEWGWE